MKTCLRSVPTTVSLKVFFYAIVLTSVEIDQQTREQMEGYALSMMSKQTFTKKDLLKEIGSLGRLS
jgi:hypothetical protein